jgi:hypothetical protein
MKKGRYATCARRVCNRKELTISNDDLPLPLRRPKTAGSFTPETEITADRPLSLGARLAPSRH